MKHHPAWLAAGLLVLVVLACNIGKKSTSNTNNSNSGGDVESGSVIKEIHMAKDDGRGKPGERTNTFEPGDRTVHCVATLKEPKAGTEMKFSWWIVDADNTTNQKIKDIDYTTGTLENVIHGHLNLPRDWPSGKYKVQVYVDGNLDKTINYSVQ